jgi:hypothetical protein
MIHASNLKAYNDIMRDNFQVIASTTDTQELAPPGYHIVNFLGQKFLEPLEIDEYGTGHDTARDRFVGNLSNLDF